MLRIDKVKKYIIDREKRADGAQDSGVTTEHISKELNIWRSDASACLNELVRQGVLEKQSKRPVEFCLSNAYYEKHILGIKSSHTDTFKEMIGYNGSIKLQLQLAKTAASYPPYGMHTLITGETGVGKSMLAEHIWLYRKAFLKKEDIPFIVFNCAEYANNPQLLLSILFGYGKGAFTGADKSSEGLISAAHGGILFLDEVHRLPPEGQELFFTVIDKGIYRRLGDTKNRTAELMIITATTEKLEDVFLTTFRRRFPMLIQIPSLNRRPIRERAEMVLLFFARESAQINMPINITNETLKILSSYRSAGNIGDLKNEIKILCAKSYMEYLQNEDAQGDKDTLIISSTFLSRSMIVSYTKDETVDGFFNVLNLPEYITLYPDKDVPNLARYSSRQSMELKNFMNIGPQNDKSTAPDNGEQYHDKYRIFLGAISTDIWTQVLSFIESASNHFRQEYPQSIYHSVAFFMQQVQTYAKAGSVFTMPDTFLSHVYPEHKKFVENYFKNNISPTESSLTAAEIDMLAFLLSQTKKENKDKIGLIIVSHGNRIASSIAEFTNEVLATKHVQSLDIPIGHSHSSIIERLQDIIVRDYKSRGVIILSENQSVLAMSDKITQAAGCQCRTVPLLNNLIALEICKAILTTNNSIDTIIENAIAELKLYINSMFDYTLSSSIITPKEKNAVIIFCVTGTGSAKIAQQLIEEHPKLGFEIDIVTVGISDDIKTIARSLGGRLKLVVGFINPNLEGIPYLGMESLMSEKGMDKIAILLQGWQVDDKKSDIADFSLEQQLDNIDKNIEKFAPAFKGKNITAATRLMLSEIKENYPIAINTKQILRLYIHSLAMIERLARNERAEIPTGGNDIISRYEQLYNIIKHILAKHLKKLDLSITDAEVFFFLISLVDLDENENNLL